MKRQEEAIYRVLKHYWGYEEFRSIQREVILSIMQGKDTLALMPTGGGKSLIYQVPTLACEGLCIVVTPLIALMKDQVDRLRERQIKAVAIHSGMSARQIDVALDNCIYGDVRFLYVSPERIATELFRMRLAQMPITLLAVDEAHCISQWGHDFRPSYLRIAELREYLPEGVPVLALTASATQRVQQDIMIGLGFAKPHLLRAGFSRPNLSFCVRKVGDELVQMLRLMQAVPGSGIIYVRTRELAEDLTAQLIREGISAACYHAGMSHEMRGINQQDWLRGDVRVMVATNAFGMGIDKSDVRFVIHHSPCDSLEQYYQEAGRAGRDGQRAYALLLYNDDERYHTRQRIKLAFPPLERVKDIYDRICSSIGVAIGDGADSSHPFNLYQFCAREHLFEETVRQAIKILDLNGYLSLIDTIESHPHVLFTITRDELYNVRSSDERLNILVTALLQHYEGVFHAFRPVDIQHLAQWCEYTPEQIKELLSRLWKMHIIRYIPANREPMIRLSQERLPKRDLYIAPETYHHRQEQTLDQFHAMESYLFETETCRNQLFTTYFGGEPEPPCGVCDNCLSRRYGSIEGGDPKLRDAILKLLETEPLTVDELADRIARPPLRIAEVVRLLIAEGLIRSNKTMQLEIIHPK